MAISIISPTGRAVQEQLQNTPPDQMQGLLNQNIGLVPFGELLAMKAQYDRMKAAPAQQAMPQTTVAQDMQQGLAGVPVHNVGSEAAYARGGIVAFAGGGLTDEEEADYQKLAPFFEGPRGGVDPAVWASLRDSPGITPYTQQLGDLAGDNAIISQSPEVRARYEYLRDKTRKYGQLVEQNQRNAQKGNVLSRHGIRVPGVSNPSLESPGAAATPAPNVPIPEIPNPFAGMSADPSKWGVGGGLRSIVGGPVARVSTDGLDAIMKQRQGELGTRESAVSDEMALREKYGIGASLKDRTTQLEGRQAELDKDRKRNKRESLAQGFFRMAEAASQPGASFLGSAATGATAGLGAFQKGREAIDRRGDDLQEKMFALQQAKEALMEAGIAGGTKNYEAKLKAFQDAQDSYLTAKREIDIANARAQNDRGNVMASISAQQQRYASEDELTRLYNQKLREGDEFGAQQVLEALHKLTVAKSPSLAGVMAGVDQRGDAAFMAAVDRELKNTRYSMLMFKGDPASMEEAKQIRARVEAQVKASMGGIGGLDAQTPSTSPVIPSQDAIAAELAKRSK